LSQRSRIEVEAARSSVRIKGDYGDIPIYITENGAAFADDIAPDGQVHDAQRVAFLEAHVAAAHRAIELGCNLKGYFVWSLMDNFEWAFGYSQRFGVVYVDYATQRRLPKDSARFWSRLARTNRLEPSGTTFAGGGGPAGAVRMTDGEGA
jgi:beta-glucosidase